MDKNGIVVETLKDFPTDLDHRNALALQELNRQIDELATIPLRNLEPYQDSIEYVSPPLGFNESHSPTGINQDLTLQLHQDLQEFQTLSKKEYDRGFNLKDVSHISHTQYATKDVSKGKNTEPVLQSSFLEQSFNESNINGFSLSKDTEALLDQLEKQQKDDKQMDSFQLDSRDISKNIDHKQMDSYQLDSRDISILNADHKIEHKESRFQLSKDTEEFLKEMDKEDAANGTNHTITVDKKSGFTNVLSKETEDYLKELDKEDAAKNKNHTITVDKKSALNKIYQPTHVAESPLYPTHNVFRDDKDPAVKPVESTQLYQTETKSKIQDQNDYNGNSNDRYNDYDYRTSSTSKPTETRYDDYDSKTKNNTKQTESYQSNIIYAPTQSRYETQPATKIPYAEYERPSSQPQKRDDFNHEEKEDNSRAIINALRILQDRVGKLESEKKEAKDKITGLEKELSSTKTLLYEQQQREKLYEQKERLHEYGIGSSGVNQSNPGHSNSGQQSYYTNTELPNIQRPSDYTLENIAEARLKVGDLKEKVDRIRQYGETHQNTPQYLKDNYSDNGYKGPDQVKEDDIEEHLRITADHIRSKMNLNVDLNDNNSKKSYDESSIGNANTKSQTSNGGYYIRNDPINEKQTFSNYDKPITEKLSNSSNKFDYTAPPKLKPFPAESKEVRPEAPAESINSRSSYFNQNIHEQPLAKQKNAFMANEEIKQLKMDIEAEREIRRGHPVQDPDFIKQKLLEKLSKPKKELVKNNEVPVWKKTERKKSSFKDSTSTAHVRKRAPIEVPAVVGVANDENGKREMPFIVGKNVGKSFSVTANLQRVFSMLKSHNSELCSVCSKRNQPCVRHSKEVVEGRPTHVLDSQESIPQQRNRRRSEPSKPILKPQVSRNVVQPKPHQIDSNENLYQMLGILEHEFRDCKEQYDSLVKQYETVAESMGSRTISESSGSNTLKAIGDDLRHCIQSMETKSDQMNILRDIMASSMSVFHRNQERKKKIVPPKRYTLDTITSRSRSRENSRRDLTVKSEPAQMAALRRRARSQSPGRAMASLSLLKSTLKVQDALGDTINS